MLEGVIEYDPATGYGKRIKDARLGLDEDFYCADSHMETVTHSHLTVIARKRVHREKDRKAYKDLVSHPTNLNRAYTIYDPMSTSFLFTPTGTDHSVFSVAKFATESDKPQEYLAKNSIRIGQKVVIDSISDEVKLHPDEQIFKPDEAKHEEVGEQEATTQQELEQMRATKSNV